MRLSTYHFKTRRETPKDADSANAALLARGRFIERSMTGVYNFLPLGWMVMENIMSIVRRHMDETGAFEARFVTLQDKSIWDKTGRWQSAKEVMYQFKDQSEREVGLGFSHEEVFVDLLGRQPLSYSDFPFKLYQFQTKFRHEPRAKSGLLRGREFIMKDLYSAHATEDDLKAYYDQVKQAYKAAFSDMGMPAVETLAAGGVFTNNFTDEFQVVSPVGEDTIHICDNCGIAINQEIIDKVHHECPKCGNSQLRQEKAIEVGNVFNFGIEYSQKMDVMFSDKDGSLKPFHLASYGIGISRAMATIVELHHDDRGIIWPKSVAPCQVHLIGLDDRANEVYRQLNHAHITVLYDDRSISAGEKFVDADLLGIPLRVTVGSRTPEGKVELRHREDGKEEIVTADDIITLLKPLSA